MTAVNGRPTASQSSIETSTPYRSRRKAARMRFGGVPTRVATPPMEAE